MRIARARLMGDPPDFLISPRLGEFGLFEFHRAKELIPRGQEIAERDIAAFRMASIVGRPSPQAAPVAKGAGGALVTVHA